MTFTFTWVIFYEGIFTFTQVWHVGTFSTTGWMTTPPVRLLFPPRGEWLPLPSHYFFSFQSLLYLQHCVYRSVWLHCLASFSKLKLDQPNTIMLFNLHYCRYVVMGSCFECLQWMGCKVFVTRPHRTGFWTWVFWGCSEQLVSSNYWGKATPSVSCCGPSSSPLRWYTHTNTCTHRHTYTHTYTPHCHDRYNDWTKAQRA